MPRTKSLKYHSVAFTDASEPIKKKVNGRTVRYDGHTVDELVTLTGLSRSIVSNRLRSHFDTNVGTRYSSLADMADGANEGFKVTHDNPDMSIKRKQVGAIKFLYLYKREYRTLNEISKLPECTVTRALLTMRICDAFRLNNTGVTVHNLMTRPKANKPNQGHNGEPTKTNLQAWDRLVNLLPVSTLTNKSKPMQGKFY